MTEEFVRLTGQLKKLSVTDVEIAHIIRLVARFCNQYAWLSVDDMTGEALQAVGRTVQRFDETRKTASRSTYLLRGVRNALIDLVARSTRYRRRVHAIGDFESCAVFTPTVRLDDSLPLISKVLSPLAYRLAILIVEEYPKRCSLAWLCRRTGFSASVIRAVWQEVVRTVPLVLKNDVAL